MSTQAPTISQRDPRTRVWRPTGSTAERVLSWSSATPLVSLRGGDRRRARAIARGRAAGVCVPDRRAVSIRWPKQAELASSGARGSVARRWRAGRASLSRTAWGPGHAQASGGSAWRGWPRRARWPCRGASSGGRRRRDRRVLSRRAALLEAGARGRRRRAEGEEPLVRHRSDRDRRRSEIWRWCARRAPQAAGRRASL